MASQYFSTPVVPASARHSLSYTPSVQGSRGFETWTPPQHPVKPVEPPTLTEGLPDLSSIDQQKAAYREQIEMQFKQEAETLQKQFRHLASWRKSHGEKLKQQAVLEIEARATQEKMQLCRRFNEDLLQLYEVTQEQRLALEFEASSRTREYLEKKNQEEYLAKQFNLQQSRYNREMKIMKEFQADNLHSRTSSQAGLPHSAQLQPPLLAPVEVTMAGLPTPVQLQPPRYPPVDVTMAAFPHPVQLQSPRHPPVDVTMVQNPSLASSPLHDVMAQHTLFRDQSVASSLPIDVTMRQVQNAQAPPSTLAGISAGGVSYLNAGTVRNAPVVHTTSYVMEGGQYVMKEPSSVNRQQSCQVPATSTKIVAETGELISQGTPYSVNHTMAPGGIAFPIVTSTQQKPDGSTIIENASTILEATPPASYIVQDSMVVTGSVPETSFLSPRQGREVASHEKRVFFIGPRPGKETHHEIMHYL